MSQYFFITYVFSETITKVKLDFSNFETKSDIQEATEINIHQNLQTKIVLISLKRDVDKLDLDKLKLKLFLFKHFKIRCQLTKNNSFLCCCSK